LTGDTVKRPLSPTTPGPRCFRCAFRETHNVSSETAVQLRRLPPGDHPASGSYWSARSGEVTGRAASPTVSATGSDWASSAVGSPFANDSGSGRVSSEPDPLSVSPARRHDRRPLAQFVGAQRAERDRLAATSACTPQARSSGPTTVPNSAAQWIERWGGQVAFVGDVAETHSQPDNPAPKVYEAAHHANKALALGLSVRPHVAKQLNVSKTTVDRLLKRAKAEGCFDDAPLPKKPRPNNEKC
jgi:hypothetical protein